MGPFYKREGVYGPGKKKKKKKKNKKKNKQGEMKSSHLYWRNPEKEKDPGHS